MVTRDGAVRPSLRRQAAAARIQRARALHHEGAGLGRLDRTQLDGPLRLIA